jgi:hypothetical protein
LLQQEENYTEIRRKFPLAEIALCSTAGEILQDEVLDNSFIVTAIHFENTPIQACSVNISDFEHSFSAGLELAKKMPQHGLRYVLILSDGSLVNGSELVKGLGAHFHKDVLVTGGLAGDGPHFRSTLVGLNNKPREGEVLAIGFYGNNITVTHGSKGGWEMFGLEKRVTRSNANVLEELEEQNALELYKKYLGPHSEGLPGTALLFPLAVTLPGRTDACCKNHSFH